MFGDLACCNVAREARQSEAKLWPRPPEEPPAFAKCLIAILCTLGIDTVKKVLIGGWIITPQLFERESERIDDVPVIALLCNVTACPIPAKQLL